MLKNGASRQRSQTGRSRPEAAIGTIRDCAMHFAIFKPFAKEQARILLTRPVHREGQKTRTWLLNPDEIEVLAERLRSDG